MEKLIDIEASKNAIKNTMKQFEEINNIEDFNKLLDNDTFLDKTIKTFKKLKNFLNGE